VSFGSSDSATSVGFSMILALNKAITMRDSTQTLSQVLAQVTCESQISQKGLDLCMVNEYLRRLLVAAQTLGVFRNAPS
jgi:hypothetical protein